MFLRSRIEASCFTITVQRGFVWDKRYMSYISMECDRITRCIKSNLNIATQESRPKQIPVDPRSNRIPSRTWRNPDHLQGHCPSTMSGEPTLITGIQQAPCATAPLPILPATRPTIFESLARTNVQIKVNPDGMPCL